MSLIHRRKSMIASTTDWRVEYYNDADDAHVDDDDDDDNDTNDDGKTHYRGAL